MDKSTNLKADLTLKVELNAELIEQILYKYVKEQFPEIPSGYTPGKVRFVINHPTTDMRGGIHRVSHPGQSHRGNFP
jgi:hypothetical protein